MIEVISKAKPERAALALRELVPGNLYTVVRPTQCRGDLVLAVQGSSQAFDSPATSRTVAVLTARSPYHSRVPFMANTKDGWLFEPAPEGTTVLIK